MSYLALKDCIAEFPRASLSPRRLPENVAESDLRRCLKLNASDVCQSGSQHSPRLRPYNTQQAKQHGR